MRYNAFISYSHAQDSDLAPHLETALEKFAKPLFKQRALNIFRDANDLSASPDLWGKIEEGLKNSEYFIFLASPKAAQSRWCKKEVDCWKDNHSMSNFLVVLTDGDIAWDESTSDFDWIKTTAIPDNLSGAFVNEPLYVDFRNHNNTELGLEYPDFRSKTVLLAATIHGKSVGNMIGDNVRQHTKNMRIRNAAISILSLLLISTAWFAYYALGQKQEAEKNLIEAQLQTNRALAKSYLSDAKSNLTFDPTLSMKLAVMAYHFAKSESLNLHEFEDQLISSFNNTSHFYIKHEDFELTKDTAWAFSNLKEFNDKRFYYSYDDFSLVIEDSLNKKTIYRDYAPPKKSSFSPHGNFIVERFRYYGYARSIGKLIQVYDLKGNLAAKAESYEPDDFPYIKFSSDGNRFLLSGYAVEETVVGSINDFNEESKPPTTILSTRRDITCIDLSSDGMMASIGYVNGDIELILFDEYGTEFFKSFLLRGHLTEPIKSVKFSTDGLYLYSQSEHYKRKWLTNSNKPFIQLMQSPSMMNLTSSVGGRTYYDECKMMVFGENESFEFNKFNEDESDYETITVIDSAKHKSEINTSNSNRYTATENGLFNSKNERLISYSFPITTAQYIQVTGFSENDDYFFAESKLYFIDAEKIIERLNNSALFGEIEPFSEEEKAKYLIQ